MKILILLNLLLVTSLSFAHPGRTDADGCHKKGGKGKAHCHNGSDNKPIKKVKKAKKTKTVKKSKKAKKTKKTKPKS